MTARTALEAIAGAQITETSNRDQLAALFCAIARIELAKDRAIAGAWADALRAIAEVTGRTHLKDIRGAQMIARSALAA